MSFATVSLFLTPHSAAISFCRLEGVVRREGGRDRTLISEILRREFALLVSRDLSLLRGRSGTGPCEYTELSDVSRDIPLASQSAVGTLRVPPREAGRGALEVRAGVGGRPQP